MKSEVREMAERVFHDDAFIENEAKALIEWLKDFMTNPDKVYLTDFVSTRSYRRQRLSEFEKKNENFSDAIAIAKEMQERKFILLALKKEWDPSFTQFVMARVCGDRWKKSWDTPEKDDGEKVINLTINKIVKEIADESSELS